MAQEIHSKTFASILVTRTRGLMLASLAVFALACWWLVLRPAVDDLAQAQMGLLSEQVAARVQRLLQGVEARLRTGKDVARHAALDADHLARFNGLFMAIMDNNPEISSVFLADENGREIILFHQPDGQWRNRISDPEQLGRATFWLTWNAQRELTGAELRELDYDARTRPWFKGALALKRDDDVFWTEPYVFFTAQEPGLSASVRWRDADGHLYVLGQDVRLLDLSRFTAGLRVGPSGVAAIFNDKGELVALPRDARFSDDAALKAAALKTPAAAELGLPAAGYAAWAADGKPANRVDSFWHERGRWYSLFTPTQLGGVKLWLAVFADRGEFSPLGWRELGALAVIAIVALLWGTLVAVRIAKEFARPLLGLSKESERMGRLDLEQPFNQSLVYSSVKEIATLAQAMDTLRASLLAARGDQDTKAS
jgi:two-component system sensor histidine kinase/response regulator